MNKFEEELKKTLEIYSENSNPSIQIGANVFQALDKNAGEPINVLPKFKIGMAAAASFAFVLSFFLLLFISPDFSQTIRNVPVLSNVASIVSPTQEPQPMLAMKSAVGDEARMAKAAPKLAKGRENTLKEKEKNNDMSGMSLASELTINNQMVSDKEITFTVENIAIDSERLLLTYSVKDKNKKHINAMNLLFNNMYLGGDGKKFIEIKNGKLQTTNKDYKVIHLLNSGELGANSVYLPQSSRQDREKLFGRIEILKVNKNAQFPVSLEFYNDGFSTSLKNVASKVTGKWKLNFTVPPQQSNAIPISYGSISTNMNIGSKNTNITINNTKVSPTIVSVNLSILPSTYKSTALNLRFYLEDEMGNVYRNLEPLGNSYHNMNAIFETSYYTSPKELYLVIEKDKVKSDNTKINSPIPDILKKIRLY